MGKSKLVTIKQALALKKLGFNEPCARYAYRFSNDTYNLQHTQIRGIGIKSFGNALAVPTVDEAIDWMRRKFDIIVCNAADPYVHPIKNYIVYGYRVKFCNVKWGWNQRERVGMSSWCKDHYAAKRVAIWIAIRYINKKKKDAKRRANRKNRK